jgi:hypothetical protein
VLDEFVKRLAGFLVDKQDEVVEPHRFQQVIDTEDLVVRRAAIEEHGKVGIGVATSGRFAAAFLNPALDLVGLDDNAK